MTCKNKCTLEKEPWRWNFTGENCKCGIPTPGNEKEQAIHATNKKTNSKYIREQQDIDDKEIRNKKINELYIKNGLLND